MKNEAIRRMESLGLLPDAVKAFRDNGAIMYSEHGILHHLTKDK